MISPVLLDFPDSFCTERLVLRAPRAGDGPMVAEAINESLAELSPWMFWAQGRTTAEECEIKARERAAEWLLRTDLSLYLLRREDGVFVGGSGLHRMDWTVRRFEVGYWCRTAFSGQGYITEAVRGVSHFAFASLDAHRVELRCDPLNEKSAAVALRAGFRLEGTLRRNATVPSGKLRDTSVYSIIRAEWEESLENG